MFSLNKKINSRENILTINTFCTYLTNLAIMGSISLFASPAYALYAVADTGNSYPGVGYGAQILDIVLDTWQNPDPNATGVASVIVRIAKDGRPFSCEIRRSSSSRIADASICDTVAQIGRFPAPFGSQNSEIALTFVYDKSQNAPQNGVQNGVTQNGVQNGVQNGITQNNQNGNMSTHSNLNTGSQTLDAPMTSQTTAPVTMTPLLTTPMTSQGMENNLRPNTNSIPPQNLSAPQVAQRTMADPTTAPNNSLPTTGSSLIVPPTAQNGTITSPNNTITPQTNIPNNPSQKGATKQHASLIDTPKNRDVLRISREEPVAPPSNDLTSSTEAMQEYSQDIFNQARTLLKIPTMPSGIYKSTVRVNVSPEGALSSTSIQKSSGKSEIDDEILRVLKEKVDYPPTPQKDQQSIWLTFTIQI